MIFESHSKDGKSYSLRVQLFETYVAGSPTQKQTNWKTQCARNSILSRSRSDGKEAQTKSKVDSNLHSLGFSLRTYTQHHRRCVRYARWEMSCAQLLLRWKGIHYHERGVRTRTRCLALVPSSSPGSLAPHVRPPENRHTSAPASTSPLDARRVISAAECCNVGAGFASPLCSHLRCPSSRVCSPLTLNRAGLREGEGYHR